MSEEPLFDPSLKKRKKKTVAFSEDPLGAEADPTTPAPATIDDTTTNGEVVDLGPKTAHELMKENEGAAEDDFKAMFGDLKKKKKKKDIPMDLVRLCTFLRNMRLYSHLESCLLIFIRYLARGRLRHFYPHHRTRRWR